MAENVTEVPGGDGSIPANKSAAFEMSILITDVAIIFMASFCVYLGSYFSLKAKGLEKVSTSEALKFPLYGSAVLFGLYILFKNLDKDWINLIMTAYFTFSGVAALSVTFYPYVVKIFTPVMSKEALTKQLAAFKLPYLDFIFDSEITLDVATIISTIFSAIAGFWYLMTKHWIANNLLGFAFSVQGIVMMPLSSYTTGALLLIGLFFYDIYWVFYTEVMVTVAKSFDAPIKLLFPRDIFAAEFKFSMLGLGDIVIPGIFVALLLHYDRYRAGVTDANKTDFPAPFFKTTLTWYTLGLVATIAVMHIFQHAQPALLYLVPACLIGSFGLALLRGEVDPLLAFTEDEPEDQPSGESKDSASNKKKVE